RHEPAFSKRQKKASRQSQVCVYCWRSRFLSWSSYTNSKDFDQHCGEPRFSSYGDQEVADQAVVCFRGVHWRAYCFLKRALMPKIEVDEKALAHLSRGLYRSPASAL